MSYPLDNKQACQMIMWPTSMMLNFVEFSKCCTYMLKILYVKNLGAGVKHEHLIHLFGRFRIPGDRPIICKLMTGRMRGQAFVTCAGRFTLFAVPKNHLADVVALEQRDNSSGQYL